MDLLGLVGGEVHVLEKPGGGKKMYSVFEGFFPAPMFILRPNRSK